MKKIVLVLITMFFMSSASMVFPQRTQSSNGKAFSEKLSWEWGVLSFLLVGTLITVLLVNSDSSSDSSGQAH